MKDYLYSISLRPKIALMMKDLIETKQAGNKETVHDSVRPVPFLFLNHSR